MDWQQIKKRVSLVEIPGMEPFDVRDKMAQYMATIAENRRRFAERKPRYLNGLPVDEPDDEDAPLYPPPLRQYAGSVDRPRRCSIGTIFEKI